LIIDQQADYLFFGSRLNLSADMKEKGFCRGQGVESAYDIRGFLIRISYQIVDLSFMKKIRNLFIKCMSQENNP